MFKLFPNLTVFSLFSLFELLVLVLVLVIAPFGRAGHKMYCTTHGNLFIYNLRDVMAHTAADMMLEVLGNRPTRDENGYSHISGEARHFAKVCPYLVMPNYLILFYSIREI